MVKTVGPIRLASWRPIFTAGRGFAVSWVGRRWLVNLEFFLERRGG